MYCPVRQSLPYLSGQLTRMALRSYPIPLSAIALIDRAILCLSFPSGLSRRIGQTWHNWIRHCVVRKLWSKSGQFSILVEIIARLLRLLIDTIRNIPESVIDNLASLRSLQIFRLGFAHKI